PDRARRLVDALLVFDEREAHVPVAAVAEADAGTDRDARVPREPQRDLQRPKLGERLGQGRPDEHRPARRLDLPAGAGEAAAEGVAAAAVDSADLAGILLRLPERHGGGDLDRLERPVVEVGLELRERGDDVGAAEPE